MRLRTIIELIEENGTLEATLNVCVEWIDTYWLIDFWRVINGLNFLLSVTGEMNFFLEKKQKNPVCNRNEREGVERQNKRWTLDRDREIERMMNCVYVCVNSHTFKYWIFIHHSKHFWSIAHFCMSLLPIPINFGTIHNSHSQFYRRHRHRWSAVVSLIIWSLVAVSLKLVHLSTWLVWKNGTR